MLMLHLSVLMWCLCPCAARGSSNPVVPEEQLANQEHLRMGAAANGTAAEDTPPGELHLEVPLGLAA